MRNIKRSEFLKLLSVLGLGSTIGFPLLTSCDENDFDPLAPLGPTTFEGNAIVIGAGAAGLAAAKTLLDAGIEVEVLEASSIHGGRVRKNDTFADFPIDLGGRWIHGQRAITKEFANELGFEVTEEDTFANMKIWYQNQLSNIIPDPFARFYTKINGSPDGVADISFDDLVIANNYNPAIAELVNAAAAEYGTTGSRISAKVNAIEGELWSSGGKDFVFKKTYYDLVNEYFALPLEGRIIYDSPVSSIDYSGDKIIVRDRSGNLYEADRVILTVPTPVLKEDVIDFIPELSQTKREAFSKIGMDAGMKIILKFEQEIFPGMVLGGPVSPVYNNVSNKKNTDEHVIMAFVMGEKAEILSAMDEASAIQAVIEELDILFEGQASATYINGFIQDWSKEEFIRGAYSYPTVGMGDARIVGASTVDDKLYFAGEAFNTNGHNSTVHGAIQTGIHKANLVLVS